uniref:RNA-directed DNA polymerase, eukaryota, reverse transcriptase zinc-binding domain protein n=1 Tax=Tanacetum cinerariifolium TaxID=118510 RepID=A0A699I0L0_TANCI|nr:RNA-directed DNA polymerase, eukaryota, reverse transcriptase zinc-binding domain protein [Tanacetum cinerariifolium]
MISVDNYVAVQGCWIQNGLKIMFIAVYTPQMMGDFNEVREAGERFGSVFQERQSDVFNSFIKNLNLYDVLLGGFHYTWTDKWASKMRKLDRFLVTKGFHDVFPHITGTVLEKGVPDHRSILLKESVADYGHTPFRFFHSWHDIEGFHDLVVDTWKKYDSSESNAMLSFKKKLQNLKQVIRVDQGTATSDDLRCRVSSMKILRDIKRKEVSDLAQKAKIKWAIEGDENTSFFHGSLKKKRCQIAIQGVLKNGAWIEDQGEEKAKFYNYFLNGFRSQRAVWDCGEDPAPGLDGFTFKFFKTFWEVIQPDVVRIVREFFRLACFPKGCNPFFIALIPKEGIMILFSNCVFLSVDNNYETMENNYETEEVKHNGCVNERTFMHVDALQKLNEE